MPTTITLPNVVSVKAVPLSYNLPLDCKTTVRVGLCFAFMCKFCLWFPHGLDAQRIVIRVILSAETATDIAIERRSLARTQHH